MKAITSIRHALGAALVIGGVVLCGWGLQTASSDGVFLWSLALMIIGTLATIPWPNERTKAQRSESHTNTSTISHSRS